MSGPEQKILNELSALAAIGLTAPDRVQLGLFCGYTNPRSGGFTGPLKKLLTAGLVAYPKAGVVALTAPGFDAAEPSDAPTTATALQQRILEKFRGPRATILASLIDDYPSDVERDELGRRLRYTNPRSGGFTGPLGSLKALGLVEYPAPGRVRAGGLLFLETASRE